MFVLRGGTIVDASGTRTADVVIEDGKITGVGEAPSEADRGLDVSGRFVAPGLIDAHVHLSMDGRPEIATVRSENRYVGAYRTAANLRTALEAGVTGLRDLGAPETMAIDAAAAVADGTLVGPRVSASGQAITMTGGHGYWFGREADGTDEVRTAAREQLKGGADVVKCMATGGVLTTGSRIGAPELTRAELEAAVDVARSQGVPTAAHAHGLEGIRNAVEAGIDSIEHGMFMDRETAELMAERGTYWVPTAKAVHSIVDAGTDAGIPAEAVEKAEIALESFGRVFEYALEAGVPIAMGTDAGTPFNHFAAIPEELELLVEHGMTPMQALEAATVGSASLLGFDDVGLVEPDYRADLLVLDSNPLEDPTVWQEPDRVLVGGRVVGS